MAKDANQTEIERQKSQMIGKGYSHNEINNPNIRSDFSATGKSASAYHKQGSGGSSNSCFPSNTEILTPSGWRRIKDVHEGSIVLSYTPTGELVPSKVTKQRKHKPCALITVHTSDTEGSFDVTDVHAVKTKRGWVRVNQLRTGDEIIVIADNGGFSSRSVLSVRSTERTEPVYNLIIERTYTFVTKNCLAHSFSYFRNLRIAFHEFARTARFMLAKMQRLVFPLKQTHSESVKKA